MPFETLVVIAGTAQTRGIDDLSREMKTNEHFTDGLTKYSHALLIHRLRMTGCTGLHSLEQRCARWILTTLDRVPAHRFAVTHEFLATLLGCSRPSASLVIGELQQRHILKVIEEMSRGGALYTLLTRYNQALLTQVMQTTVCSGRHNSEQRCTRWLLTMRDHVGSDQLNVTQESLSMMRGVRRPTVTLAMSGLQRKGIETHRGHITILDRGTLESTACECYQSVKATFARLLPGVSVAAS